MSHEIFLSYSRRDIGIMQRVRDDLRDAGLGVWTDEGIHPGTPSWKEAIEQAIRGAGVLIVLLSPEANESIWVQREIDYAEVQGKPILSMLVRGQPKDAIPFALAGSQFVDVRRNYEIGIQALLKRCFRHLPNNTADTVIARYAQPTVLSPRRRQQLDKTFFQVIVGIGFAVLMALVTFAIVFFTQATNLAVPPVAGNENKPINTTGDIELRYNYDTFVLQNRSDSQVNIRDLRFDQETDADGLRFSFDASIWRNHTLLAGRCVQAWRIEFSYLAPDVPPADSCYSRVGYRATVQTFWVSEIEKAVFFVRHGGILIATCPSISASHSEILNCYFDL